MSIALRRPSDRWIVTLDGAAKGAKRQPGSREFIDPASDGFIDPTTGQ